MNNRTTKWERQNLLDCSEADLMGVKISDDLLRHVARTLARDDISDRDGMLKAFFRADTRARISALSVTL